MKKMITLFAVAGMGLALAPAAQAGPGDRITGVTATASSENTASARLAIDAVNGAGMTSGELATGMHNQTYGDGWEATVSVPQWFRVDLGATYDVGTMYVWNGEPGVPDRGVRLADIYYSTVDTADPIPTGSASSGDWTLLTDEQAFAINPGTNPYGPTDAIALNINARVIGFYITALQTGNPNNASFAELQFAEGTPAGPDVRLDGGTAGNVDENQPIGTVVGGLSTLNTESWGATNLAFAGGTDDASFSISGTNLLTAEIFDEDVKSSYSIDVSADDGGANSTTNTFTITIDSVAEPLDRMFANAEVKSTTTLAATLEAMTGTPAYAITAGEHHAALFEILNTDELHLKTAATAGQVGAEYFVEVVASGDVSDSMLIKVTVVSGEPKGTVFIFR